MMTTENLLSKMIEVLRAEMGIRNRDYDATETDINHARLFLDLADVLEKILNEEPKP